MPTAIGEIAMNDRCELMTVREVAAILKLHPRSVWRMAATGAIPGPIRLAEKTVRWRRVDLEEYLANLAEERVR